jgi:hypothetical protein
VTVDGQSNDITNIYSNSPACGAVGTATFTLKEGNYNFTAKCTNKSGSGNFTITKNACLKYQLTN